MALITDHWGLNLFTWMAGQLLCLLVAFFFVVSGPESFLWLTEMKAPMCPLGGKNGGMTLSKQAKSRSFHDIAQPPVTILHRMIGINVRYNDLAQWDGGSLHVITGRAQPLSGGVCSAVWSVRVIQLHLRHHGASPKSKSPQQQRGGNGEAPLFIR